MVLLGILTAGCFFCGGSFSDPPCWSESTCFLLLLLLCVWAPLFFLLPGPAAPLFWAFPLLCPRAAAAAAAAAAVAPRCSVLCSLFRHSGLAGKIEIKQKQVWQAGRKKKKRKCCDEIADVSFLFERAVCLFCEAEIQHSSCRLMEPSPNSHGTKDRRGNGQEVCVSVCVCF